MPIVAISARIPSSTPGWASRSGTTAWPLIATMPLVTVQTWRSCTRTRRAPPASAPAPRRGRRGGDALEQDVGALPDQPPGAGEDEEGEEHGDERVGHGPAGERDDRGRRQGADRAERVAQDVQIGAAGVEAALPRAVQHGQAHEVDDQPGGGDGEEEPGPNRLRVLDPLHRLDHHPPGDAEQRRPVHQGGQDLPAQVAVGLGVVGRTLGDPGGEQRRVPARRRR